MAKRSKWKILGLFMVALVLIWLGLAIWQMMRDEAEPISALSYQEIESRVARGSDLTEAQLASEIARLRGRKVRWSGTVEDVDTANTAYIDIDGFFYDVRFTLSQDEALKLSKGVNATFTGVIDQVERYWLTVRVELRSVQIESVSE